MPLLLLVLLAAVSLAACSGELGHRRPHAHTHQNDPSLCHKSLPCGGHIDVHYPFFLANAALAGGGDDGHPAAARSYCGYPGMAVTCDGGCAILRLGGHNYTILDISYENHAVRLVDRDLLLSSGECPRVTHNVTVPGTSSLSAATANNEDLSFFYDCVFTAGTPAPPPDIPPINCSSFPGGRGVSFVARRSDMERQDAEWPRACRTAVVVPVLKDWWLPSAEYHQQLHSDGYGQLLKRGFQLSWEPSAGPCYVCEQTKGKCSYNHSGVFVGCLRSDGSVRNSDCGKHGLYLEHAYFS